jgi:hypothetical protein
MSVVSPLIPSVIDVVKNIIDTTKGDDEAAIKMLLEIIGSTEENKTRAALVISNAKAIKEFGEDLNEKIM